MENFFTLNTMNKNSWKLIPVSSTERGFFIFSERELVALFWKIPSLKLRLQALAGTTFPQTPQDRLTLDDCMNIWLPGESPGAVIKKFIASIDPPSSNSGRKAKQQSYPFRSKSLVELRDHVNVLRRPGFNPQTYEEKGYVLRGSIKTDGFRLSLLAFKLRELQSVRYRRYPAHLLPSPHSSTTGGTDGFLTEVRNVFRSPGDLQSLLNCTPDQVKILGIDLGQACLVGSFLLLPERETSEDNQTPKEYNHLAVKTKAVYQPIIKLRRWMNRAKAESPKSELSAANEDMPMNVSDVSDHGDLGATDNKMSINEIECSMPALRGMHADIPAYFDHRHQHEHALDSFYNGPNHSFKRHVWDAKKAKREEYAKVTDSMLRAVGGSIGAKRKADNHVIIAIGMAKFGTKTGLTSLDGSFQDYFVNKVLFVDLAPICNGRHTGSTCLHL